VWLVKNYIFSPILFGLSFLPLEWLRGIGSLVGFLGLKMSKKARFRTRNNLLVTHLATQDNVDNLTLRVAKELGKTLVETVCIKFPKKLILEIFIIVKNNEIKINIENNFV
jgi:lauroyl/myristoyl acyltransferase